MYQRTTNASRRMQRNRNTNWLHVSQWFKPVKVKDKMGIESIQFAPQMTRTIPGDDGKPVVVMHGQTRALGRNRFKRACKELRLNRVLVERKFRDGQASEVLAGVQ